MLAAKLSEYSKNIQECFNEVDVEKVQRAAERLLAIRKCDGTLFIIGNGGSAATASHMAVDFEKVAGMRVVSLTNVPNITAWGNDVDYESVFSEQLKRQLGRQGQPADILIAISASGNSPNILHAAEYARGRSIYTIGFIGFGGGKLKEMVDIALIISSRNYGVVEDFHLSLNHILSQYLKDAINESVSPSGR
jgi:D-sedoheptulose 7-phosphate isomerase